MFHPVTAGALDLRNRMVMAPMTRSRADQQGVVSPLTPLYYAQRASAGLIVTEGTAPSASGLGYARTPGIYSAAQVAAWKQVTEAVHRAGGVIVLQVMHVGRIAHPLNQPEGARIVAPSAIAASSQMWTDSAGMQPTPVPEALTPDGIAGIVAEYAQAVRHAREAGFDGVELHAANGYLPNQFLSTNTNQRTDGYGGSIAARARFVLEVVDAMVAAWAAGRIGIRVSPGGTFNDMLDADPQATYTHLAERLNERSLAYLHVVRPVQFAPAEQAFDVLAVLRRVSNGVLIANGGFDRASADQAVSAGLADLVSFGRPFISNPNLPDVFRSGADPAPADGATFYTPGAKGYTDYPAF